MSKIKKFGVLFWKYAKNYSVLSSFLLLVIISLVLDILGIHNHGLRTWSHIILAVSSASVACIIVWRMIEKLRFGYLGIDVLALAAIVTAVVLKEYWAAAITIAMYLGGEALEIYAEKRATADLSALLKRAPQKATLLRGRKTVEVAASAVHRGDKLVIKPGEIVPVDCVIIEGQSSFDESALTGEPLPVDKTVGDDLLSGSVNADGLITVKALRSADDSQYEQIVKMVSNASVVQAPFVRMADRFSVPFSLMSFVIAGGVWIASGDAKRFLEVLVVATPCPLILGAPIGLISGMSKAAERGIIIKRGSVIEKLANLKILAFDKTGTLTLGLPKITAITSYSKTWSKDKLLALAAGADSQSVHILGKAIAEEAQVRKIKPLTVRAKQEHPGLGIEALVGREQLFFGKLKFLKMQGIDVSKAQKASNAQTTSYLALNGKLIGSLSFEDVVRNNTQSVLQGLQGQGILKTIMLTGDDKHTAEAVAKKLGISEVKAECLPINKVEAVQSLSGGQHLVGFVGDGVNDAPVLAAADVGVALGARGSTAASESADAVIMQDDLSKALEAIQIAKRTLQITKQTILAGIGLSVILMAIFATGKFRASYGAAIQELVDVTVIINALRARN